MHVRPTDPALRPPAAGLLGGGPHASASASSVAVVPAVRPVSPAADATSGPLSDAGRAGIDLAALLGGGADALVTRERPSAVALATVLERARASLVRGDAGDALAALDDAWEGAMRTESGWYLRSAALTVLGLPGEAERVLQQSLVPRGGSVALLFLQSVVRSALGDTAGARESLLAAEARRPAEPVLMAWRAVLTARAGDRSGALRQISEIPAGQGQSALLGWARQSIAAANADASRAVADMRWEVKPEDLQAPEMTLSGPTSQASVPSAASVATSPVVSSAVPSAVLAPMESDLRRVGAELVNGTPHQIRIAVRTLLQSLATGGTLDQVARPDQVPAVRSVLASLLAVVHPRHDTPPVGRSFDARTDPHGSWRVMPEPGAVQPPPAPHREARTVALSALWRGDLRAADLALPRVSSAEGDVVATAIRFLVEGAREEWGDRAPAVESEGPPREAIRARDLLLTQIRVGLSLLQQSSSRQEAQLVATSAGASPSSTTRWAPASPFSSQPPPETPYPVRDPVTQHHAHPLAPTPPTGDTIPPMDTTVSAQLHAAAHGQPRTVPRVGDSEHAGGRAARERSSPSLADSFRSGQRMRALALVCMALAFAAMVYGQGVVAIALAGGASWLALRSSSVSAAARAREQGTPDESSR